MDRGAEELLALGRAIPNRPVLYFSNDAQLLMLSRRRDDLSTAFRFLLPESALVEDLVDKRRFLALAGRHALPVPGSRLCDDTLDDLDSPWGYPCIVKPASRVGWFESKIMGSVPHKVLKVSSAAELREWGGRLRGGGRSFFLQEYVAGADDAIVSYHAYLDAAGRTLAWFVGKKVRTYPMDTGRSTCLELARDEEVRALGESILARLEFRGVVKIDFKRDARTRRLFLLEINPRFNLWHYLGAVSGVNLPGVCHRDLTGGKPFPSPKYRTGIRWISVPMDLRATWSLLRSGRLDAGAWIRSYAGRKIYNRFAWSDPMPVLSSAADAVAHRLLRRGRLGLHAGDRA
jgi:predicted ATP-grasp superfamily ATP-dependent carboligase